METPTKKRINRELSGLRSSDGFQAASKSRTSIPSALLASGQEGDEDDHMDVDDTPSRKRTRHAAVTGSQGIASTSSMPNLASPTKRAGGLASPTKASFGTAATPTKSKSSQGFIFVSTNDPRLKRSKISTPKSSPTKSKPTPTGRVSPTKGRGKGKEKERFGDEYEEADDNVAPETPSRSRVGVKKVNFNERGAHASGRSLGLDEESDEEGGTRRAGGAEYGDEDEGDEERHTDEEGSSQDDEEDGPASPTKKSTATPRKGRKKKTYESLLHVPGFVSQTSFDAYFQQISIPARTSNNAFTALLPTLSPDEYWELLDSSLEQQKHSAEITKLVDSHVDLFPRFAMELAAGFNLLFYGYGSKRNVLNRFAKECLAKRGDVAVLNGFKPGVGIKELIDRIDTLRGEPEDADASPYGRQQGSCAASALSGADLQAQRIYKHYTRAAKRPLYIVVHSIDSPMLRAAKSKAVLSLLASHPRIHLVGSVDHMNAPLIWSQNEAFGRGHEADGLTAGRQGDDAPSSPSKAPKRKSKTTRQKGKAAVEADDDEPDIHANEDRIPTERGFTWLWHDLTTYEHYDVELRFQGRDLTSPTVLTGSGKSKHAASAAGGPAGVAGPLTEAGAKQVLSSVTDRSRSIFALLAEQQIANIDAEADERVGAAVAQNEAVSPAKKTLNATATQMSQYAIPYESLFVMAREKFIATSDQALRGLLQEFRDHGMVVTGVASSGGGEMIWIPLARNVLERILKSSEEE